MRGLPEGYIELRSLRIMQGFEVTIDRLPRMGMLTLFGLMGREEVRRQPLCYECHENAPVFVHNGKAMCGICRVRAMLRVS